MKMMDTKVTTRYVLRRIDEDAPFVRIGDGVSGTGPYLMAFDPDAIPADPDDHRTGLADFTDDPARAMTFASPMEAMTFYRTQSSVRPLRDDGRPNRPLTAFSMLCEPLP